jgi:hypothetical protein
MTTKEIAIVWGSIVLIVAIIFGTVGFVKVYAPNTQPDALTTCATYESARSSHFCVELARAHAIREQAR